MSHLLEPAIIAFGRRNISDYYEKEYRDSLERAFRVHRADFIVLDSNIAGQKFLSACIAWAIDSVLLYCDNSVGDGQGEVSSFRLTDKGKHEILGIE